MAVAAAEQETFEMPEKLRSLMDTCTKVLLKIPPDFSLYDEELKYI